VTVGDQTQGQGDTGRALAFRPHRAPPASQLQLLSDRWEWISGLPDPRAGVGETALARGDPPRVSDWTAREGGDSVFDCTDGGVPKLVIASPSGADSLDRAAVAGVSASVPFPPLPTEFKGIRSCSSSTLAYNSAK